MFSYRISTILHVRCMNGYLLQRLLSRCYVTGTVKTGKWKRERPPDVVVADIQPKTARQFKYLIYTLNDGEIKANAIEAARIVLKRGSKTDAMWKLEADIPVTRKPVGTRMGKGKGKIDHYIAKVPAGAHIFMFNCSDELQAKYACKQVDFRLPIKAKLIATKALLERSEKQTTEASTQTENVSKS